MMSVCDFEYKQIAFVFTNRGEKISFKNDNILITDENGKVKHQSTCYRLFLLFICGDYCITTGLLERSVKFGINIVLMTPSLRITKIISSRAEGNVLLRRMQYGYNKTDIASHIISNKIHNQKCHLEKRRNRTDKENEVIRKLEFFEKDVLKPNLSVQEIMGIEGVSAKIYFSMLFKDYNWDSRRPRVKGDIINCLLDIGYTMIFNIINGLLEMYGFDVYVGILHTQFFHRKSLVCDLEEPFRVIIDSSIIKALNLGQINKSDFWKKQEQYILPFKSSATYIDLFIRAIMDYKREIFLYFQNYYRAFIRGKKPDEFPVFYL